MSLSEVRRGTEPYIRYTREGTANGVSGWIVKEGKRLQRPCVRFLQLRGSMLSNHREEGSPATWTVNLSGVDVRMGPRKHEITIRQAKRRWSLFIPTRRDFLMWLYALRRSAAVAVQLEEFYELGEKIGDGINGDVLAGTDRVTGDIVAIKSLPIGSDESETEQDQEGERKQCDNDILTEEEIRIARSLDHPHLVKTFDVFRDEQAGKVHMVMEFVAGGELQARVDNEDGNQISEINAARIARNILSAVVYLHDRGIVHRDIKLENVLVVDVDIHQPMRVKLADFGSSTTLTSKRTKLNSAVGTPFYLPPEMIEHKDYDSAVDLWACGVLLYITISQQLPFLGFEIEEYFANVLTQPLEFPDDSWNLISIEAQDFISALMRKDPHKRMTARQALLHPWLTSPLNRDAVLSSDMSPKSNNSDESDGDAPRGLFGKRRTATQVMSMARYHHRT